MEWLVESENAEPADAESREHHTTIDKGLEIHRFCYPGASWNQFLLQIRKETVAVTDKWEILFLT